MSVTVADLIVTETKDRLFAKEISIAESMDLVTSSWRKGDPTRTTLYTLAVLFEMQEGYVADFIRGGFLDFAEGDWAFVKAEQDYGVPAEKATFAECLGTLVNGGALTFDFDPGDVIVSKGANGKTYHNTDTLHLGPSATLTNVHVIADEIGSASNAGATEINTMVSSYASVTFSNTTAAVASDDETAESVKARARLKPASLSPNGPSKAYAFVALSADLTDGADVTKVRVIDGPGTVTMYCANASGPISGGDLTKVRDACAINCVPLGITPTISNSTAQTQAITYTAWIYDSAGLGTQEVKDLIFAALTALFLRVPIGGDGVVLPTPGSLYLSDIIGTIMGAHKDIFRVTVATPSGDTAAATLGRVFTLGAVTPTVNIVGAP